MKITMKIYYSVIVVAIFSITASCKKLIEVDSPNNQLATVEVFRNDETAIASLTSIYSRMVNVSNITYNLSLLTGLYTDELKNFSTGKNVIQVYSNSLNATDGVAPNIWQLGFNYIYHANAVWEGCNESTSLSADIKTQLMAEARFIRAFWNFYLTNIYGDIPLTTTTNYEVNKSLPKSPQADVYALIIRDLQEAEANLNASYLGANTRTVVADRVRPNKFAAAALLSRVYLYVKNYADAEIEATKVIANKPTYDLSPIAGAFLKSGVESVWQLMMPSPVVSTANTYEGERFILVARPPGSSTLNNNASISERLLSAFETGDQRKSAWIGKFTDVSVTPNVDYYYPNKYKVRSSTTPTEYTIPLRVGEQYLIRAEARVMQGKLDSAKADLNALRKRAGLGNILEVDPDGILKAVIRERQVELFTEYGHRWFDLRRLGVIDEVMKVVSPLKGGAWSAFEAVWPIPILEVQKNVSLIQNVGYVN